MRTLALALALILSTSAIADPPKHTLAQLDWLAGQWRGPVGTSTFEEHWMAPAGGTMVGMGRMVDGARTTLIEAMTIRRKGGKLVMSIGHGAKTTDFTLVTLAAGHAVFANPDNAFPSRIIYRREGDKLTARIEGKRGGQPAAMDFPLTRVR